MQRMATVALGCGLLGTELLRRQPTFQAELATPSYADLFQVGQRYTFEQKDALTGRMDTFGGMQCQSVRTIPGREGLIVYEVDFKGSHGTASITVEGV